MPTMDPISAGSPGPQPVLVRPCEPADIPSITDIYAHHVLHGLATFEIDAPTVPEMQRRFHELRQRNMPCLAAVSGSRIVGYAYAAAFRERAAFCHTVEDSIYLHPDFCGRGIGKRLLEQLLADCASAGFWQMVAVIGDRGNERSIRLHRSLGFVQTGVLSAVGYKHRRWVDVVLMQRAIRQQGAVMPPDCPDPSPGAGSKT
jgi:L-amino acid N-acyltransferase YncA